MTRVPLADLPHFVNNVRSALKLAPHKDSATVVFLVGDLGSGKTTFVKALAAAMGVEEFVQSPTYVIMKKYSLLSERLPNGARRRFKTLVHIDAYRLARPQEFQALKPERFLRDPSALVVVEWPEHVAEALPEPDAVITFNHLPAQEGEGGNERLIEVQ